MNYKFLIVGTLAGSMVPFIISSVIADMTKWTAIAFGTVLGLLGTLVLARHTALGAPIWLWFAASQHQALLFATFWVAAMGVALWAVMLRRVRARQLDWKVRPSQSQFGKDCVAYLESVGWTPRGSLTRVFIDLERMDNAGRRATFVFSAAPFPIDATRRLMSQVVWKPFGPFILVTWGEEAPGMQQTLARMGWRWMTAAALTQADELH